MRRKTLMQARRQITATSTSSGGPGSFLALLLSLSLVCGVASASGVSSLTTEVRGADGGHLAGAVVLLTGQRLSRLSVANNAGQVQFRDLPASTYTLKFSAEGFSARTIDDVMLPAGAQKVLMVTLEPAGREPAAVDTVIGVHAFDSVGASVPGAADGGWLHGRVDFSADRQTLARFPTTAARVSGGRDLPLLWSEDTVTLRGVSVGAGFRTDRPLPLLEAVGDNLRLLMDVESLSGSASTGRALVSVPEPVRVTYAGIDPVSGDAGVVLPPGGSVRSRIETHTSDQALRVGAAWDWRGVGDDRNRVGSSLMLGYGEWEQDIRRSDTFASGESSLDDVAIDQERATIDLSLFGQRPFGNGRFSLYGEMGLRWQHASADMHSAYRYLDPASAAVARTTRDSQSDTSIGAFAGIELGYRVGRSTVLSVSARVAEGNAVPTLATPDRTGADEIRLRHSDDERRESFGIGLSHAF